MSRASALARIEAAARELADAARELRESEERTATRWAGREAYVPEIKLTDEERAAARQRLRKAGVRGA